MTRKNPYLKLKISFSPVPKTFLLHFTAPVQYATL